MGLPDIIPDVGWNGVKRPSHTRLCDHIDCAIDAQKKAARGGAVAILSLLIFGYFVYITIQDPMVLPLVFTGFLILIGFFGLRVFKSEEKSRELSEYKYNGTINGMSAYVDPSFDELIELDEPKECINYGLVRYNQGKHDDAIKAFDKAIMLDPRSVPAWNNKALYSKN